MDIDSNAIESAIKAYYRERYNIEDNSALYEYIENSKQSIFNASLSYANTFIGLNAKLHNVFDGVNAYTINSYNYDRCMSIAYTYVQLCMKYNKVANMLGYSMLTDIGIDVLNKWKNDKNLSNKYSDIVKLLFSYNELSLSDLLLESRNNIGVIAILNHNHNWANSTIIHEHRLTTNTDKQSLQTKYSQYLDDNTDNKA